MIRWQSMLTHFSFNETTCSGMIWCSCNQFASCRYWLNLFYSINWFINWIVHSREWKCKSKVVIRIVRTETESHKQQYIYIYKLYLNIIAFKSVYCKIINLLSAQLTLCVKVTNTLMPRSEKDNWWATRLSASCVLEDDDIHSTTTRIRRFNVVRKCWRLLHAWHT